jgi:hypothetical protein
VDFKLKKPCNNCPFSRTALKGWLGESRSTEIANGLLEGKTFPCHKTTKRNEDMPDTEQHCAGALIMIEKMGVPHQMMQIAERLGLYDNKDLQLGADVVDDADEFVNLHTS